MKILDIRVLNGPNYWSINHKVLSATLDILECARGGILRSGLAFDRCSTGIVTNVAEDHIGLMGINSLDDMAHVKSVIAESVSNKGLAILNEGSDLTYAMKNRVDCKVALFSLNHNSQRIIEHCRNKGLAAIYKNKMVVLVEGEKDVGKATAELFDRIIIRVDEDTRGRTEKEIIDLLNSGVTHFRNDFPEQ